MQAMAAKPEIEHTYQALSDSAALQSFVNAKWDEEIIPALRDYIEIPSKSPAYDANWIEHGYIERVVKDAAAWVESQKVAGLKLEIIRLAGRTPVIFFEAPAHAFRRR